MAYDPMRGRIVMFGGVDTAVLPDTWEFSGSTWTKIVATPHPRRRSSHGMVYDAVNHDVIVVGGATDNGVTRTRPGLRSA